MAFQDRDEYEINETPGLCQVLGAIICTGNGFAITSPSCYDYTGTQFKKYVSHLWHLGA